MAVRFRSNASAIGLAGFAVFLVLVRIISMIWALVRLYDFRLTRVGEDLRTEYGLFTKVAATVPIRRVQAITINAGPLHRWLERATVRVATAGGAGKKDQSAANVREWLAPLIHQQALPHLLQQVLPGFDLSSVNWQPVHPRAFARAREADAGVHRDRHPGRSAPDRLGRDRRVDPAAALGRHHHAPICGASRVGGGRRGGDDEAAAGSGSRSPSRG